MQQEESCRYCGGRGSVKDPVLFVMVKCRHCEKDDE